MRAICLIVATVLLLVSFFVALEYRSNEQLEKRIRAGLNSKESATTSTRLLFRRLHERKMLKQRRQNIENELPVLLDVLALGISGGLSFDASLDIYCEEFSNELSTLLREVSYNWRFARQTRAEALHTAATSLQSDDFSRFCDAVIRSGHFGNSVASDFLSLAKEIRTSNKVRLEEKVAKVPVKMLFPLGTLILPSMLILILGPVVVQLME